MRKGNLHGRQEWGCLDHVPEGPGAGLASGMLVLVPAGVTLPVARWLFSWAAGLLRPVVRDATSGLVQLHFVQDIPAGYANFLVSVLAVLLLLLLVYLVGVRGQLLVGRRLIAATEKVWLEIPLSRPRTCLRRKWKPARRSALRMDRAHRAYRRKPV